MEKKLKTLNSYNGNIVYFEPSAIMDKNYLSKMILVSPRLGSSLGGGQVAEIVAHACRLKVLELLMDPERKDLKLENAIRNYGGFAKPASMSGLKEVVNEALEKYPSHSSKVEFLVETANAAEAKRLAHPNLRLASGAGLRIKLYQAIGINPADQDIDVVALDLSNVPRTKKKK